MFLSKENLALHLVAFQDGQLRPGLSGIFIDPKKNVTVASDGKRLVEITAPALDPKKYPAPGVALANGEAQPFILPAKTAQEILKVLPKGKDDTDPIRYAALAKSKDGKLSIVTTDGKKAYPFSFAPIDAEFPDYESVFPKAKPQSSVSVNPELFRQTLKATAIGDAITLHIHPECIVMESKAKDGTSSRTILMGYQVRKEERAKAKGAEPKAQAKPSESLSTETPKQEEAAAPAKAGETLQTVSPAAKDQPQSPNGNSGGRNFGFRRYARWKGRRSSSEGGTPGQPSDSQRAFHTFLIRTRGAQLNPEDLQATNVSEKIEELKKQPAIHNDIATWPQWRKLYSTLAEKKVDAKTVCFVLNSLHSIKETSSAIDTWLKKDATPAVAAQAA